MSEGRHILYLVTSSGWGGAEKYVSVLAREAAAHGEVHVIAGTGNGDLFDRLPHEAFVMRSRHLTRRVSPISDLRAVREIRAYIRKNAITLVHANSTKAGLIASLAVMGMKRRPLVIYTAHGWAFLESARSPLFRFTTYWSERLASRLRNATIVLSEMERRVALERGLADEAHLHLIPLGIARRPEKTLPRDAARKELLRGSDATFLFGTVANAYPAKALPLLIEAFDRVAETRPETALVIIGDGPSMPEISARREISPFKDRIFLAGHLPDASEYLSAFDVFTLSSTKEGMPWAILEAARAGLPIVATGVGAIPEMLRDGVGGLIVPPDDVPALAEAMARVHDDAALRTKLKNGSPRIAETRTEELMVRRTLKAYWAEA